MIFETRRLYVTKWRRGDLHALHDLYNDTAIRETIPSQLTMDETRSIFENQINLYNEHPHFGRYFITEKSSKRFIGIFLLKKSGHNKGVEIGYSLKKNCWKKGYATETVKGSINWIFELKKFSSMHAITDSKNENSKKVLLKCGFVSKEEFRENGEEMNLFSLLDITPLQ